MRKGKHIAAEEYSFKDVLEYHPNWFVRWGITIIAIFVITLLILTKYIDEPEILNSRYRFSGKSSPYNNIVIGPVEIEKSARIRNKKVYLLEFNRENPETKKGIYCKVDTLVFDCDRKAYFINAVMENADSGVKDSGDVSILIEQKSLLDRLFGKSSETNGFSKQ
ncbi:MAG TPA: hypothetical protein VN514_01765 [Ignavibacteria bacterium]|nr:hypothetical protein [Ignavibacteria bacterium]